MAEFLMPKLGADMTAGTLAAWHKKPGDAVRRGDVVAEVETEKGDIDVEIFTDGVIEKLLVQPGEKVAVGAPLAIVREAEMGAVRAANGPVAPPAPVAPAPSIVPTALATSRPVASRSPAAGGVSRLRISPAARRLARELAVDPTALVGTGRGGAITLEDIQAAATAARGASPSAPAPRPSVPAAAPPNAGRAAATDRLQRMRKTIAAAMARSKREIPHYYLGTTIDMHACMRWLAEQNAARPVTDRLLYGVLLLKAVALALRATPELNAIWENDEARRIPDIHVGVAISLRQGGLVAPALHHTDRMSLDELMTKFRDLVNRARAGSLRSSELSDPTITVTSLGEQGVEAVYGVIYPPQVALVGFGKLVERPWSVAGQVVSRPVITATLSADHRVSDGHRGALLLAAIDRLLQEPAKL
jgi:pyruvate dehydrogenase E2 component (dihydrolipoyllysine-residue acetyltransferase)